MGFKNYAFPVAMPEINDVLELTGYATMKDDWKAFEIAYELGREDAQDGDPCRVCGALPAQRAGYAFGYVGELGAEDAYRKWNAIGREE